MKFFTVAAAASFAIASVYAADTTTAPSTTTTAPSTTTTTSTDSVACDLTKLTPLLADSDLVTCSTSSGLVFPPTSAPSANVLAKVCAVPECASLLKKVAALNLGDCTLGALKINSQLIVPVTEACAKATTSTNSTNTTTTTTVTAGGDVATSGSGSAESSEESNNSSVSATTVPSPSPTTGSASTLSMAAAGSVVVVVMVALL